jgi:hypothetical protein
VKSEQLGLWGGIGALLVSVFLVDVRMALGFTPWLLYVLPLGLTYWTTYQYSPFIVAATCTILIFVGYAVSPPLMPESVALTNRMFGTVTFWVLAFLIASYKRLSQHLSRMTAQLRLELMERTQDLGRAVSAIRTGEQGNRGQQDSLLASEELKRHVADVLTAENRRLQQKVMRLEQGLQPAPEGEESLERARNELQRLGKQLEQLQRELLP